MKKVLSAAIALTAVAAMSVSAFAVDAGSTNGSANGVAGDDGKVETSVGTVEGLGAGTNVTIEVQPTDTVDNEVSDAVKEKLGDGVTFNTTVKVTVDVQPNGSATVTVAWDGQSNRAVYVGEDGVETFDLKVSDDQKTASFSTTHFSTFYLVTVPENGQPGTDNEGDKNEPTGVVLAIVPAAVAAAAVVVSKKRK